MPIDNFTTDKYVGQEEELLEYVTQVSDLDFMPFERML